VEPASDRGGEDEPCRFGDEPHVGDQVDPADSEEKGSDVAPRPGSDGREGDDR
jgi:hypothetical protein